MRGKDKTKRKSRIYRVTNPETRFWKFVDKMSAAPCWVWTGATSPNGYGRFRPGPKHVPMIGPHRFSFELHNGPIENGHVIMHKCDTPACVNPDHLTSGTNRDNTADAMSKGRMRALFKPGYDPRRPW